MSKKQNDKKSPAQSQQTLPQEHSESSSSSDITSMDQKRTTILITRKWLENMLAILNDAMQHEFEAAVVIRNDRRVLSAQMVGNRVVPKFPGDAFPAVIQNPVGAGFVADPDADESKSELKIVSASSVEVVTSKETDFMLAVEVESTTEPESQEPTEDFQ